MLTEHIDGPGQGLANSWHGEEVVGMPRIDWYAIIFVLIVGLVIGHVVARSGIFQVEVPLPEGSETPESSEDDENSRCQGCPLIDICDDPSPSETPDSETPQ